MKIEKKDKPQVYTMFRMFLLENGHTLRSFCEKFELNYSTVIDKFKRNSMTVDELNDMVNMVDCSATCKKYRGKWRVSVI